MLDNKVPRSLFALQDWFGKVLLQKMGSDEFAVVHADTYINETANFSAFERMQLYHESYWLRLLGVLAEDFPLVVRLFGEQGFQTKLAIDYLFSHPPKHWSLTTLNVNFVPWLEKTYHEHDRALVIFSAKIDHAIQRLFLAKRGTAFELNEQILQAVLSLSPTARLFELPGNLFQFRKELLAKPVEYWQEHDFPFLAKERTYYFVLFRKKNNTMDWQELSKEEHLFLSLIDEGLSIEQACDKIEEFDVNLTLVEQNMAFWVEKWLTHEWLSLGIE